MWNLFKKNYVKVELLKDRLRKSNILNNEELLGVTEGPEGKYTVGIFRLKNEN